MKFEGREVQATSRSLQLDSEIGSGKEGQVFSVEGSPSTVVKIFFADYRTEKEDKIQAMVKDHNRPTDRTEDDTGVQSIIWPQEVVTNPSTQEFLGYSMPREDPDKAVTALVYAISELNWGNSQEVHRLGAALNLAIMVNEMHKQGHAIGDFNHKNILLRDGYVKLIDCDGFHIKDQDRVYPGETYGPRYAAPEGRPDDIEDVRKADRFGLAIHIFQFLMEGEHPFRVKGADSVGGNWRAKIKQNAFPYVDSNPDTSPPEGAKTKYNRLPEEIRENFEECFVNVESNKDKRPTPEEWEATIREVIGLDERTEDDKNEAETPTSDRDGGSGGKSPDTSTRTNQTVQTDSSIGQSQADEIPESPSPAGSEVPAPGPPSVRDDSLGLGRSRWRDIAETVEAEVRRTLFYIGAIILILLMAYILLSI